jgi:hypothetical protein
MYARQRGLASITHARWLGISLLVLTCLPGCDSGPRLGVMNQTDQTLHVWDGREINGRFYTAGIMPRTLAPGKRDEYTWILYADGIKPIFRVEAYTAEGALVFCRSYSSQAKDFPPAEVVLEFGAPACERALARVLVSDTTTVGIPH